MSELIVTSSPHLRDKSSTRNIMLDVIIALVPAGIAGIIMFGFYTALLIAVTVLSAVLGEFLFNKVVKKPNSIGDLSAVVTGLLLAYNLPPSFPLWMAVIGAIVAIVVVKGLFGGIGQNFANPAIAARIVLLVSFPTQMTTWVRPFISGADAISSATPLVALKDAFLSGNPIGITGGGLSSLLFGLEGGCIGEVSRLFLILGGIYLIIRKVIVPTIPVAFIGTVFIFSWLLGASPVYQIFSGGLMLGAIFMATDYTTSPMYPKGKIIMGVGCGIITVLIRLYANMPEGVSYSILIMNIITPLIERVTIPKPFGYIKQRGAKQ